jgi:DNA-binding response OmpR family regulator
MGGKTRARMALVVGELEERAKLEVEGALHAADTAPRFYPSLRHAQHSRAWSDAGLVLVTEDSNRIHPFSTCWHLRASGLSARLLLMLRPEHDTLLPPGVMAGADDITLAPANPSDIARRAARLFEQSDPWPADESVGPLRIDWKLGRILLHDRPLHLTKTERGLLSYLMHRRCLVRWDELALVALGSIQRSPARALASHLAALRRKLTGCSDLIETVHGVGCRLRSSTLRDGFAAPSFSAEMAEVND